MALRNTTNAITTELDSETNVSAKLHTHPNRRARAVVEARHVGSRMLVQVSKAAAGQEQRQTRATCKWAMGSRTRTRRRRWRV